MQVKLVTQSQSAFLIWNSIVSGRRLKIASPSPSELVPSIDGYLASYSLDLQ
jgi:hypothetical protein